MYAIVDAAIFFICLNPHIKFLVLFKGQVQPNIKPLHLSR